MRRFNSGRRESSGQALALVAISVAVLLAAAAVVVDGGNAMGQERGTQNASDSAALAGALVIAEKMGGSTRTDSDVLTAMNNSYVNNATTMGTSLYISYGGNIVGTVGRGGSIPSEAAGVQANGSRNFDTFLASVVGQNAWTTTASATAIAGALRSVCSANEGCAVMPVTFSIPVSSCDGTNQPLRIGIEWPLVSLATARADTSGTYESNVPLCLNGPGGVGWLDMGCGGNLRDQILTPCNKAYDIPTWLHSASGDVNGVDTALNSYRGKVILLPLFDSTCRDVPSSGLPADCTDPGNGDNLYYHIPRFAEFLLDRAYISGNNPQCNQPPGVPLTGGNGATTCIKGWFVRFVRQGRVGPFDDCNASADPSCLKEPILGIQLIR